MFNGYFETVKSKFIGFCGALQSNYIKHSEKFLVDISDPFLKKKQTDGKGSMFVYVYV